MRETCSMYFLVWLNSHTKAYRFQVLRFGHTEPGCCVMVWAAWAVGGLPCCVEGFPKAPWTHLIQAMPVVGRKMRLALSCVGLDALGHGLGEMNWDAFEVPYAYDIDESLAVVLVHMHGKKAAGFHIGHRPGDLLKCNVQEWERVDWVAAGPPCPAFSSIGDQSVAPRDDAREKCFAR